VVVPIVFHTGPQPWQSNRRLSDLVEAPAGLERFVPPWEPEFWDLAERSADVLEQSPGAWMSAMAVVRALEEEHEAFLRRYTRVLARLEPLSGQDRLRWQDLLWVLFSYAVRRRPRAERDELFAAAVASHHEAALREEVRNMSQNVMETWDQWAMQHYTQGMRNALLLQGRAKFGPPTAEIEAAINTITDATRLERLIQRAVEVNSWQQLLATP
jgi:hypothetical protein